MKKRKFSIACIFFYVALLGCCPRVSMLDVPPLLEQASLDSFEVAHRGNLHRGLPDNSLPALQEAVDAGVRFLEVDVRRSAEGDLFLFHDSTVSFQNSFTPRIFRGRRIETFSATERAKVFLNREGTIGIPTLRDALDLVKGTDSSLQLDLKGESDSLLQDVLRVVSKTQAFDNVVIQLKDVQRMVRIGKSARGVRVIARCRSMRQVRQALVTGVWGVELERWISADAIRLAHEHGVLVAINLAGSRLDRKTTRHYFRTRGTDSIMTDFAGQ